MFFIGATTIAQNNFPASGNASVGGTTTPANLTITSGTSGVSGLRFANLNSGNTGTSNKRSLTVDNTGNVIIAASNVETSLFSINTATTASSGTDWLQKMQVFGAGYPTSFVGGYTRSGFNVLDMYKAPPYTSADVIVANLVDRGGKERFLFQAQKDETGVPGPIVFGMLDGAGNEIMKVSDGLTGGAVYMHLIKPNSRLVIGSYGTYQQPHKLVVAGGSALVEGNVIANGNIGIGTSSFTDGGDSYRLSVSGAVRAHRVKVYTTWADFVFDKDYDLPTIGEVEQHIKEKGHLKDIPSAAEVEKNGIELGEMNKLLLQKIEELTLYIIDLNKKVEAQDKKIDELTKG